MEGGVGSGGVLKKKSSSGCLIIKKKSGDKNSDGGFAKLSDNKETNIRPRLVSSSSSSSDEDESLEFMRRKINEKRLHKNGSEIKDYEKKKKNGIEIGGEKKRSKLDLFEFDEYDEFDEKKNDYSEDRFKIMHRSGGGIVKEFGVGSKRNLVVDKRKKGCYNGSSSVKSKEFESEDDEAHMPISMLKMKYHESADEPIRLQGKNGVLKVMVNKKKKMVFRSECKNYDSKKVSDSDDVVKKETLESSHENRGSFVENEESVKKEKGKLKLEKVSTPSQQACSSKKRVKKDEEQREEGKSKRGGSTEKQMLREKIRGMLIDAGWTIDYRPRRNRDYLDSVYINPSGTAYWSVVKAYDAFKKQSEEDNGKNKSDVGFAPIAEDLISKLTRQTKKKIEREMRRKSKEDGMTMSAPISAESSDGEQNDERLSSYIKQKRKLRKGKSHNVDRESDDELTDDSPKRKKPAKTRVEKPSSYAIKSNVDEESDELIHDSPKMKKPANARVEKSSSYAKSQVIQGKTSKNIGRCTLLVRGKGENSDSDGYVPYSGKRTVLAWLIDSGTAKLSEKVQYMNRRRTRVMLEGWITRDGVHCGCCSKILAVSKFELHAGSKLRQAFQNIVLESGLSLLQCQIDAWNKQNEPVHRDFFTVDVDGDDPDDDTCGVCGDGGDLICCDSCPSTFHQICLEIKMLPSDDWHCPNCICKFCGHVNEKNTGENDSKCDGLNKCSFCEKKYHKSCSERVCAVPISSNGASFCGLKCQEIYDRLQKILGVKNELGGGFSWSFIQRSDVSDTTHRGFSQRVECNSKLAVALSVMDECFLPIVDGRSGINLIHNVVYNCGSNFNRLNYHGFYTAILERGDEIISAASIRIHGARLAEMPFIGTREMYRRQGMCRRLLSAIETELCSLKVEQLIVPAISEHTNTWTTVFGFHELEDVHKREIKYLNMLVFPGTDMLQKQLLKQEISNGVNVSESTKNQPGSPVLVEKIDITVSSLELKTNDNTGASHEIKTNDENTEAIIEAQNADKTDEENETRHGIDEKVADHSES